MVKLTKYWLQVRLVNMTKIVKLYDAKTQLSSLVERAAKGEEIIIAKGDQPMARLIPFAEKTKPRAPGGWEGRLMVAEDFDAPLPLSLQRKFENPE
jgi:prevent-host-death family protein